MSDSQRGHQHTLFYKATSTGNTNYSIRVVADFAGTTAVAMENAAKILAKNMQYSYRVYDTGYIPIFSNDASNFAC